uniref:Uncharacterized protein n=1 Tax=Lactuca sativa TaxID=4236 RepID=A0A9R1X0T4_LACSA|nr:hypothetical protein LSAT_V11C700381580 [Lactuca sativa]
MIITSVIPKTIGKELITLVTSREQIPQLLKLDDVIDLVIPRGSNNLFSQIKSSIKILVLGYPSTCNAMETLLLHKDLLQDGIANQLMKDLYTKASGAGNIVLILSVAGLVHVSVGSIYSVTKGMVCLAPYFISDFIWKQLVVVSIQTRLRAMVPRDEFRRRRNKAATIVQVDLK